jgi:hypothetical protein
VPDNEGNRRSRTAVRVGKVSGVRTRRWRTAGRQGSQHEAHWLGSYLGHRSHRHQRGLARCGLGWRRQFRYTCDYVRQCGASGPADHPDVCLYLGAELPMEVLPHRTQSRARCRQHRRIVRNADHSLSGSLLRIDGSRGLRGPVVLASGAGHRK